MDRARGGDGFNLINVTTGCLTTTANPNVQAVDPLLGALTDNGGATQTHLPLAGSPALDQGRVDGCLDTQSNLVAVKQRGDARPFKGRCDVGVVELQLAPGAL